MLRLLAGSYSGNYLFLLDLLFFVGDSFCTDSKNQQIVTFMSSAILIMDFHKNDMRESKKINVRCIDSTSAAG